MNNIKKYFFPFAILLSAIFYIYDLGNLDALRQGTEGFYLQISKEMSQLGSYLTPYYREARHWSKPPLHFLFPFPFYATGLFTNIFAARLSIVILTFAMLFLTSKWVKKHFKIEEYTTFLFFASSVGLIKYGRIYMMEIPLSLLTFVGCLYFYDYYLSRKLKDLVLPSILIAASILIKGPVSYVLAMASISFFFLFDFFKNKVLNIKPVILVATTSLLLGSLWFIISYINYGQEFFDYFFLRENVGKFTAKSYPIRHVFQGLIIFALPWSLFIPVSYLNFKDYFNSEVYNLKDKKNLIIFLLIHCFFFFVIWLIPSQRSHHYAMPSIPFFLTLLLISLVKRETNAKRIKFLKFSNAIISASALILLAVFCLVTYFINTIAPGQNLLGFMILTLIVLSFSISLFIKSQNFTFKSVSSLIFIGWIWAFVAPKFIPAFIPHQVIELSQGKKVIAHVRKPYFVEEALNQEITLQDPRAINTAHLTQEHRIILRYDDYINYIDRDKFDILHKWSIWRRRIRTKEIYNALVNDNIEPIRQYYVLLRLR